MKSAAIKKFSILGLVLVATSAITSAFVTSEKKSVSKDDPNGEIKLGSVGVGSTCTVGVAVNCDGSTAAAPTGTTGAGTSQQTTTI